MRDLRDPQELGSAYLEMRKGGVPKNLAVRIPVEDYSHGESIGTMQPKLYRKELEERAAAGDKYARSVLESGQPLE